MKTQMLTISFILMASIVWPLKCYSQIKDSAWIYNKTVDFFEGNTNKYPPEYKSLKITEDHIKIDRDCYIQIEERNYIPSLPFQILMKSSIDTSEINIFLQKTFNVKPQELRKYYKNTSKQSVCNQIGRDILIYNETLLIVSGGSTFHQYKQTFTSIIYDKARSQINLNTIKPSPLPFDLTDFTMNCSAKKINFIKGIPQSTEKCGPNFYPYVATHQSIDWLSKLVGSFKYGKNGVRYAATDYDNPVANGLHPVFLVLPPMNDIVVVYVTDQEFSEERDSAGSAYLSIKNQKVVDVLTEGCDFDVSYTCGFRDSDRKFQLQPDGHFKKIQ